MILRYAFSTGMLFSLLTLSGAGFGQCFQPVPSGLGGYSVAVADFNKDGKPDLVTGNFYSLGASVVLGQGDGTFGTPTTLGSNYVASDVAVGDFNKDGNPDLAGTSYLQAGKVWVALGQGDGTFGATTDYQAGSFARVLVVNDFNKDGNADLAVANLVSKNISVLLGQGDGSFGVATNYAVGQRCSWLALGDFNNDGNADLVTTNDNLPDNLTVLLGQGDGSFGAPQSTTVGSSPRAIGVGDFNQDGKADLAIADAGNNAVHVLLGAGDGTFGAAASYGVGTFPIELTTGDVNGDGNADLLVSNTYGSSFSVLLGQGDGTFGTATTHGPGYAPAEMATGDFNGDGKLDIATNVGVLLNGVLGLSVSGAPLCAGQALSLSLSSTCSATVELSDKTGSFASPVSLGTVAPGNNAIMIPTDTPGGGGYRIRVISADPSVAGQVTAPFTINALGNVSVALFPATPSRICPGQELPVTFSTTGACPFPVENVFTVQLSSATGSFTSPTVLGTAQPGTTPFALPPSLPAGTGYRVRILSSLPAQTSFASAPFKLEGPSLAVTPGVAGAPVCRGSAVVVSFNLPAGSCAFPDGNVFTAQLSSASGSFSNPVSLVTVVPGVSNSVTIPAGVAPGTGYRIRLVSSSPALTSNASIPFRVNACPTRMSAEAAELVVSPNPVSGRDIRVRVSGIDNPAFGLTSVSGRNVAVSVKADGSGEFILTPKQTLTSGVYVLQASEGGTRLTRRVLVTE